MEESETPHAREIQRQKGVRHTRYSEFREELSPSVFFSVFYVFRSYIKVLNLFQVNCLNFFKKSILDILNNFTQLFPS